MFIKSTLDSCLGFHKRNYVQVIENREPGCMVSCHEQGEAGRTYFPGQLRKRIEGIKTAAQMSQG